MENHNETKKIYKEKNDKQDYQKNNFFKRKSSADLLQKVLSGLITKMFSY